MRQNRTPAPLLFKPDLEDAARRWDAFFAGEIVDRPIVCVSAPVEGKRRAPGSSYRDRVFGDMDQIIENALVNAEATFYGGESIPAFWLSLGTDEASLFCGPQEDFVWEPASGETNWSKPWVDDWEKALPLRLNENHPLWLRLLEFYRRAASRMGGKMLLHHIDLHTNMDLLAPIRGPQRLCEDLLDRPEAIDRAMADARAIFRQIWRKVADAGRMDEFGYCQGVYSMEGAAVLQCDFSCMVSPAMFRRWILPALEEEAEIARHVMYHWDGPGALKHTDDIVASRGLHTVSYVPNPGVGHLKCMEIYKRVQAGGKAVSVGGNPDEVKRMHRELRPEKTVYSTWVGSQREAEELLAWFVANT